METYIHLDLSQRQPPFFEIESESSEMGQFAHMENQHCAMLASTQCGRSTPLSSLLLQNIA